MGNREDCSLRTRPVHVRISVVPRSDIKRSILNNERFISEQDPNKTRRIPGQFQARVKYDWEILPED
jgi:hypothetical protein